MIEVALKARSSQTREALAPLLKGRSTLVLGPSGSGKSTLINLLAPDARAQVGEVSQARNSGRHTTTSTQWYWLDAERSTGLRTTVPIGARLPMTAGSGAQVLCAWEAPETVATLLQAAEFSERALAEVRRRGWAQSVGQREPGVASVSAPVFGQRRRVLAAISISGPVERLGRSPGQRFAPVLTTAALRLQDAVA